MDTGITEAAVVDTEGAAAEGLVQTFLDPLLLVSLLLVRADFLGYILATFYFSAVFRARIEV